jgi:WD40 repeat protein
MLTLMKPERSAFGRMTFLLSCALLGSVVLGTVGCGGGSSGSQGGGGQVSNPQFSLSVTPASVSIVPGGVASFSLSASGSNGYTAPITVQGSALPTGVSIEPTTARLTPGGTAVQYYLLALPSAPTGQATFTLTGTSGGMTQSASLSLSVASGPVSTLSVPFRERYVRTDAATEYFLWINSTWIIYNPPTSRFFVTEPDSNRVFAFDAKTETLVGSIIVPGAYGIDDTPDHTALYVGTQIGDVYVLDPVGLTVTKRYPAAGIGPNGFNAYCVLVMADGRLALLGAQGGLPGIDGYGEFAFWDPATNALATYQTSYSYNETGATVVCGPNTGNFGGFARTPDRTTLVISGNGGGNLCEIDEATGADTYVAVQGTTVEHPAISPDGKWIVLPSTNNQAVVYDAATLAQVASFTVGGGGSGVTECMIGPDSQTLYVSTDPIIYAYNLSSGQQIGWLPNIVVPSTSGGEVVGPAYGPQIEAMDGTGLLVGPLEEGVGFLDTTALRTGPVGTQFMNGYVEPATGPVAGGTTVNWGGGPAIEAFFGNQEMDALAQSGSVTIVTPPGSPGPIDVYTLASDSGVEYLPESYSYGPTVLEVIPNAAAAGGGPGVIYGYGFGPMSAVSAPSGLQVTVGGTAATITFFDPNAYGVMGPPFPLQSFTYTIPPGVAGSVADVTVTSSSGSTTVHGGITYLPDVQSYPLAGAALAQGVYDSQTDLYYFTDATEIQVFSRTSQAWLAPITFPAPNAPQRLWGIALSPDGSKLAVSDISAAVIYLINPSQPSSITAVPVPPYTGGIPRKPAGLAITDAGVIYSTSFPDSAYFKLDPSTGQLTEYAVYGGGTYMRTAMRSDGSAVYTSAYGDVLLIDTATDDIYYAKDIECAGGCDADLAFSSNQTTFTAADYFYDADLNAQSWWGLNMREMLDVSDLYGEKLSPDGTTLFQPTTTGMDVLDARLGTLLKRIALPITLSPNYDALVSDGKDNVLLAITGDNGDGVTVIDLTSLPAPAPLPYHTVGRSKSPLPGAGRASSAQPRSARSPAGRGGNPIPGRRTIPHVTVNRLIPRALKVLPVPTAPAGARPSGFPQVRP